MHTNFSLSFFFFFGGGVHEFFVELHNCYVWTDDQENWENIFTDVELLMIWKAEWGWWHRLKISVSQYDIIMYDMTFRLNTYAGLNSLDLVFALLKLCLPYFQHWFHCVDGLEKNPHDSSKWLPLNMVTWLLIFSPKPLNSQHRFITRLKNIIIIFTKINQHYKHPALSVHRLLYCCNIPWIWVTPFWKQCMLCKSHVVSSNLR